MTPQEPAVQSTAAATADATVRADQAAVATAKFNLDNTVIRAPISGKTGSLLVQRGNLVRSGSGTPLVVINQVRPILVRFAIPSSQLSLVLQYGAKGGLPVTAVPGGIAPASPSIDSLAAAAMANPVQDAPSGSKGRSAWWRRRDGRRLELVVRRFERREDGRSARRLRAAAGPGRRIGSVRTADGRIARAVLARRPARSLSRAARAPWAAATG